MTNLFWLAVALYLLLQAVALRTLRGYWRHAAWVGVGVFALAASLTLFGLARGAELSPIYLVLTIPILIMGLILLLTLFIVSRRLRRTSNR